MSDFISFEIKMLLSTLMIIMIPKNMMKITRNDQPIHIIRFSILTENSQNSSNHLSKFQLYH